MNSFQPSISSIRSDSWQLVQSECLPSSVNNVGCSPFQFHESTIYSPVNSSTWTRVTVQLPDHVSSGQEHTDFAFGKYHDFMLVHPLKLGLCLILYPVLTYIYSMWLVFCLLQFHLVNHLGFVEHFQCYPVPLDPKGGDRRASWLGGGPCLHRRGLPRTLQRPWLLHQRSGLHL